MNNVNDFYNFTKQVENSVSFYQTYPLNTFWSDSNFKFMSGIIKSDMSDADKVKQVINSQLYSHGQMDPLITNKQFEWWKNYFKEYYKTDIKDLKIKESSFWTAEKSFQHEGNLFSIDLFRSYTYVNEIKKHCKFKAGRIKAIELGAGCGSLSRVFVTEFPNTSYVIVDIPESLYFSYLFVKLNFPDKKIIWVNDSSFNLNDIDKYDYVFIPVCFNNILAGFEADIFMNTCSLGEMTNQVIQFWFDMFQNKMKIDYIFSVNRFLNTITDTPNFAWRKNENECCCHFDYKWDILEWQLEPSFTLCPYYEGFASRCVEIIAKRNTSLTIEQQNAYADKVVSDCKLQDWHLLSKSKRTIMTLNDNRLNIDLGKTGTLFKLWDSIRIKEGLENVFLFLQYINEVLLHGKGRVFEETFYYNKLLAKYT